MENDKETNLCSQGDLLRRANVALAESQVLLLEVEAQKLRGVLHPKSDPGRPSWLTVILLMVVIIFQSIVLVLQ